MPLLWERVIIGSFHISTECTGSANTGLHDYPSAHSKKNVLQKPLPMWKTDQVTEVCVDDFAFHKGMTYGTVIIDSSSHMVIDLIASREWQDVAAKFAEYPNLKVVSRDGSPTYAAVIREANPKKV